MAYKTPGVYILEKDAFPNSVVEVETAVPAFIGYTKYANNKGVSLFNKPWRITSMAQFIDYYGAAPDFGFDLTDVASKIKKDADDALTLSTATAAKLVAATAANAAAATKKTTADTAKDTADKAVADASPTDALKKAATDTAVAKDAADKALAAGPETDELKKAATDAATAKDTADKAVTAALPTDAQTKAASDAATAAAAAGSEALAAKKALDDATDANTLAKAALEEANKKATVDGLKAYLLNCDYDFMVGDTKYLLTQNAGKCLLYLSMQLFFQNGGGACYVVSVGSYDDASNEGIMAAKITKGIDYLKKEQEPTMLVVPDAVRLDEANCISVQQFMLKHCGQEMRNRFAILDLYNGYLERTDPQGDCVAAFRDALGINNLDFAGAYYPWVNTTIVQDSDLDYTIFTDTAVQTVVRTLLTNDLKLNDVFAPPVTDKISTQNFNDKKKAVSDISQTLAAFSEEYKAKKGNEGADDDTLKNEFKKRIKAVHQLLSLSSPRYVSILGLAKKKLNLLPPSAAMAGVYTAVDNSRGVWKAPANVSLNSVVSPAVNISQEEQEDLNVTTAGKSINAIRSFIGEGTLVWGARTLDGNSLDWRYVNVRRTMIMLEESLRLATKAYVFEPNVANTWVTIKSMIRNFLTGIWKRGGLAGASPDDAFSIYVGLGETMTAEDILEGMLNVTVLVALSRPAEFIEITFQQQLQKS